MCEACAVHAAAAPRRPRAATPTPRSRCCPCSRTTRCALLPRPCPQALRACARPTRKRGVAGPVTVSPSPNRMDAAQALVAARALCAGVPGAGGGHGAAAGQPLRLRPLRAGLHRGVGLRQPQAHHAAGPGGSGGGRQEEQGCVRQGARRRACCGSRVGGRGSVAAPRSAAVTAAGGCVWSAVADRRREGGSFGVPAIALRQTCGRRGQRAGRAEANHTCGVLSGLASCRRARCVPSCRARQGREEAAALGHFGARGAGGRAGLPRPGAPHGARGAPLSRPVALGSVARVCGRVWRRRGGGSRVAPRGSTAWLPR